MKIVIITSLFFFFAQLLFSEDSISTNIKFKYIENEELRLLYRLQDIEYLKVSCTDTNMRGKVFLLTVAEFKEGKIVKRDTVYKPEYSEQEITIDGKQYIHVIDGAETIMFPMEKDSFEMAFLGQLQGEKFKLLFNYDRCYGYDYYEVKKNFVLTAAQECGEAGMMVKVNEAMPILALTPPLESNGYMDLCLLKAQAIEDWYKKCKINHYYLVYLTIMDKPEREEG